MQGQSNQLHFMQNACVRSIALKAMAVDCEWFIYYWFMYDEKLHVWTYTIGNQ